MLDDNGLSGSSQPIFNWQFAICNLQSCWSPLSVKSIELLSPPTILDLKSSTRYLNTAAREVKLMMNPPWIRSLGKLSLEISTQGWRFPTPIDPDAIPNSRLEIRNPKYERVGQTLLSGGMRTTPPRRRLQPSADTILLKERLLYLLQPPLENLLAGRQVRLYSQPYPYQLEGIAFLMPRHAALLADEMGLGKTMQAILAIRLLFHAGLIQRVLIVCPISVVSNWARELRQLAEDVP
jgi:hypothetical protein